VFLRAYPSTVLTHGATMTYAHALLLKGEKTTVHVNATSLAEDKEIGEIAPLYFAPQPFDIQYNR
jgi:hypothetical protein